MNAALKPYFAATIGLLKGSNNPKAIREAFDAAMLEAYGADEVPPPAAKRKRPTPAIVPEVCVMSAIDMKTIMHDFWDIHGDKMKPGERDWFKIMTGVVNKGDKLAGRQVSIVNSITERIAGMAIIM